MTEKELATLYALMLKYSTPEVIQSLYYPTADQNRINKIPTLFFTEQQQEYARKKLINAFVIDKILEEV
jgi:hypothetical protein